MIARCKKHTLQFHFPAGTSKGVLLEKDSWFIFLEENGITGIGECSVIPGISPDYSRNYGSVVEELVSDFNKGVSPGSEFFQKYPSIAFGWEMAQTDLKSGGKRLLFDTPFTAGKFGIPINGLIWMGNRDFMEQQISKKLGEGFTCLKLKVGSLQFNDELEILTAIRKSFPPSKLEIRLDANGAFGLDSVMEKLQKLSVFHIHSIEQPIAKGNWEAMAGVCAASPIPVALDEELSGITDPLIKKQLLETIKPTYYILKPGMVGGFCAAEDWIAIARKLQINGWVTSALESNIGLNAIAQWTYTLGNPLPQGLGTGKLYTNNFSSPLEIRNDKLYHNPSLNWNIELLNL